MLKKLTQLLILLLKNRTMNKLIKPSTILLILLSAFCLYSFKQVESTNSYKCLIQMVDYSGENAYVIISLINPKGDYEETLYVQGDNEKWYHEIDKWWNFYGKKRNNLDAITGATIAGGARSTNILKIPSSKIDAGYSIRFETSVEDQKYYVKDIEFLLTSESVQTKKKGIGYIKYIRMMAN